MLGSCTGDVLPFKSYVVSGLSAAIVILRPLAALLPAESVTLTLNATVPAVVGTPVMIPPLDKDNPVGNAPDEIVHDSPVPLPPEATSALEYETPTVAAGSIVVSIVSTA